MSLLSKDTESAHMCSFIWKKPFCKQDLFHFRKWTIFTQAFGDMRGSNSYSKSCQTYGTACTNATHLSILWSANMFIIVNFFQLSFYWDRKLCWCLVGIYYFFVNRVACLLWFHLPINIRNAKLKFVIHLCLHSPHTEGKQIKTKMIGKILAIVFFALLASADAQSKL